jgi:hypothetical protein
LIIGSAVDICLADEIGISKNQQAVDSADDIPANSFDDFFRLFQMGTGKGCGGYASR